MWEEKLWTIVQEVVNGVWLQNNVVSRKEPTKHGAEIIRLSKEGIWGCNSQIIWIFLFLAFRNGYGRCANSLRSLSLSLLRGTLRYSVVL